MKSIKWLIKPVSVIVVFILVYLLYYLINPFGDFLGRFGQMLFPELMEEILIGLVQSWIIVEASVFISKFLDKKLSWNYTPMLRIGVQLVLVISVATAVLYLQHLYYTKEYGAPLDSEETISIWQFFVGGLIVSIFVSSFHTGYSLLEYWKESMAETAELKIKTLKLKEVAMQSELQSLKLQLDPHFMFNNFSTLSALINEDKEIANRFLDNLSQVYRYMIINLKKNLVTLQEEITFVKSYNYLILIRHGENVRIDMNVPEEFTGRYIPPIGLQLLIENAIKHNRATQAMPLQISISVDRETGFLWVKNNLQRIANPLQTTGLGLRNIINRYGILSDKVPVIEEKANSFEVGLPLLS
ncbi:sensor histidine kinase [Algoriphagus sp. Y33]|uniref:sensor histidine kinase n=1 Tax=Algoriphagus sp. Y33 TaxID=2772483 RepID=UPI0017859670|nr:histidine kinase [Algoriphagus sp. Y33]